MEPTPEPDPEPGTEQVAIPITVSQMEERPVNNYFQANFEGAAGLEALSAAATNSLPYMRPLQAPDQPSPHSSNNLNFILNPTAPDGSVGGLPRV